MLPTMSVMNYPRAIACRRRRSHLADAHCSMNNPGRDSTAVITIVGERLKEFLEDKGMEVEAFSDSGKALARLKEKNFAVVVTDLKMAGATGMDVLKYVREKQPLAQVILITAYGQMEAVREAEALQAFEIVHKPFQMAELHKIIKKAARRATD